MSQRPSHVKIRWQAKDNAMHGQSDKPKTGPCIDKTYRNPPSTFMLSIQGHAKAKNKTILHASHVWDTHHANLRLKQPNKNPFYTKNNPTAHHAKREILHAKIKNILCKSKLNSMQPATKAGSMALNSSQDKHASFHDFTLIISKLMPSQTFVHLRLKQNIHAYSAKTHSRFEEQNTIHPHSSNVIQREGIL